MKVQKIPLNLLQVSRFNTRQDLDSGQEDSKLDNLAESIRKHGLLSPIVVRRTGEDQYEIISGQRRFLACQRLGVSEVDCIVREGVDDNDSLTLSLVENVHRADVNPIDKARALKNLYTRYGSYAKVAEETAWTASTIAKYIALLDLPQDLQNKLSTAEGPAKVGAMAKLAQTFKGKDALDVYERISGFKASIQEEILRRSGGDVEKVEDLVQEAQEGAFDTRMCGGLYGCGIVKDILEGQMNQKEFEEIVQAAAERVKSEIGKGALKEAARNFWKTLGKG